MNYFQLGLAFLMLITGSINTLSVKWADTMKSASSDGKKRSFDHPFVQACGMFLGEMSCLIVYYIITKCKHGGGHDDHHDSQSDAQTLTNNDIVDTYPNFESSLLSDNLSTESTSSLNGSESSGSFNPLIFYPPALCDMCATSLQYIGLTFTYASSFQMLRGAVIIFTGILSRFILRRKLAWMRWIGILFVIGGLSIVGMSDIFYARRTSNRNVTSYYATPGGEEYEDCDSTNPANNSKLIGNIVLGDVSIICAQVLVSFQMVYEEKFVSKYNIPALQAVGCEGFFGFTTLSLLLVPMFYIPVGGGFGNNPRHVLEDVLDAFHQLASNLQLLMAFCTTVVSIAFFNFAGISVTKELSATTRMVLDSMRTLVIWSVSMAVGWQTFQFLQLCGFIFLLIGMCIYNNILFGPVFHYARRKLIPRTVPSTTIDVAVAHDSIEDAVVDEDTQ